MKRVIVKNLSGMPICGTQLEDPQPIIDDAIARNLWGLPGEYIVEVTDIQSEIDSGNQKQTQITSLKQNVKSILQKADTDITQAEIKIALLKFLRASLLKGDLE